LFDISVVSLLRLYIMVIVVDIDRSGKHLHDRMGGLGP